MTALKILSFLPLALAILSIGPAIGFYCNIYVAIAVTVALVIWWWWEDWALSRGSTLKEVVLLYCGFSVLLMWVITVWTRWEMISQLFRYIFSDTVYQFLDKYILR